MFCPSYYKKFVFFPIHIYSIIYHYKVNNLILSGINFISIFNIYSKYYKMCLYDMKTNLNIDSDIRCITHQGGSVLVDSTIKGQIRSEYILGVTLIVNFKFKE